METRHDSRHGQVNNNAQGWGVAALVTGLALACALSAWYIHTETYRNPTDPMFRSRGNATPTPVEEVHAPPASPGTTDHGTAPTTH